MGSRAIYHDGWMASATGPRLPWVAGVPPGIKDWTPDQDEWRLYNLDEDWSQANDLAAEMPEKVAQMKETFAIEAARNSVYPIGGGLWVLVYHPELRISTPYREWNFGPTIIRMPEFCAPALGNRANLVTIDAELPEQASGVLYALGSSSGGLTCYLDDGYLCYEYNLFIIMRTKIRSEQPPARRPREDRDLHRVRRGQTRRPAEHHPDRQRRAAGRRRGADQRAAAVHRQRLPRHRHLPRRDPSPWTTTTAHRSRSTAPSTRSTSATPPSCLVVLISWC